MELAPRRFLPLRSLRFTVQPCIGVGPFGNILDKALLGKVIKGTDLLRSSAWKGRGRRLGVAR